VKHPGLLTREERCAIAFAFARFGAIFGHFPWAIIFGFRRFFANFENLGL